MLIDGEIRGAVLGKFKYGPYIIEDVTVEEECIARREAVLKAVCMANPESRICRFMGQETEFGV